MQMPRFLFRLAGNHIASRVFGTRARAHTAPEGLEYVRATAGRFIQISGAVLTQYEFDESGHHDVQRRPKSAACFTARLSGVLVRIPLRLLRRHSSQLYTDAQSHIVSVSAKHAFTGSVHAKPESRYVGRNNPGTAYFAHVRGSHTTGVV